MPYYFRLALDNGVKPGEVAEIITHLAFYSGWANAMSAVQIVKPVFAERKMGTDQLPSASPTLLSLDNAVEEKRVAGVEQQFGNVAPGVVQYTTDVLFRDFSIPAAVASSHRSRLRSSLRRRSISATPPCSARCCPADDWRSQTKTSDVTPSG